MDIQTVIHPDSDEKEQISDTYNSMDESQIHSAKWKKTDMNYIYDSIYYIVHIYIAILYDSIYRTF